MTIIDKLLSAVVINSTKPGGRKDEFKYVNVLDGKSCVSGTEDLL